VDVLEASFDVLVCLNSPQMLHLCASRSCDS
jgi:hypothetical protein